jgi:hypothetical protein
VSCSEAVVGIEKLPYGILEFRELFNIIGSIILALIVKHMDGLLVKILGNFRHFVNHVS